MTSLSHVRAGVCGVGVLGLLCCSGWAWADPAPREVAHPGSGQREAPADGTMASVVIPVLPEADALALDEKARSEAAAHAQRAQKALNGARLQDAWDAATSAFGAWPSAAHALLEAAVLEALNRPDAAFERYLIALNLAPEALELERARAGVQRTGPMLTPPMGVLALRTHPEAASVSVLDMTFQSAEVHRVGLAAGAHSVRVAAGGWEERVETVTIRAGLITPWVVVLRDPELLPLPKTEPLSSRPRLPGWILLGAGGALACGGVGSLVAAASKRGERDELDVASASYAIDHRTLSGDIETLDTVGWVLTGVGVSAVIAGTIYAVLAAE